MKLSIKFWLSVAIFGAASSPALANNEILVIPDIAAAYLYDGAGSKRTAGNQVSLALFKEGHYKEYRIESEPPGLVCDEKCEETAQNLPEGKVTLRIVGNKPVSFMAIPLTGKWSSECEISESEAESDRCVVHLDEMTAQIRVSVSPDIEVGTLMRLPEGGSAMIAKVDTQENYVLVAAHQLLGPGVTWMDFDRRRRSKINANSPLNGRANVVKLLENGSSAAAYCHTLNGGNQNWYLPASGELRLFTKEVLDKIPGIDPNNYTWTSTENSLSISKNKSGEETYTHQAHAMNNGSGSIHTDRDAYKCTIKKDGSTDCTNIRRYQTLCFRRVPI